MNIPARISRILALLCCAFWSHWSVAGPGVLAPAAHVPSDVDVLVVLDDAADIRESDAGAALLGIARSLMAEGAATKRWAMFAAQLDWTSEEAFDALLGRRVVLVGRRPWSEDASWALLCDVTRQTEKRLRKRLNVAPRALLNRRTIYAVENGRFECMFERPGGGRPLTTVLVGRPDSGGLFEELMPLLRDPPRQSLLTTAALKRATQMQGDAGLVYVRMPAAKDASLVARLSREGGDRLSASVLMEGVGAAPDQVEWSTDVFERLSRGMLLCVIDRRATVDEAGDLDQATASLLARLLPWMAPSEELDQTLGGLHAFVAGAGEAGGLRLGAAVQSADIRAMPAPGDRMMRDLLIDLSTGLDAGVWSFDYEGRWPQAVRSAPILQQGAPLIAGPGLEIVWRYAEATDGDDGWLVLATDRTTLGEMSDALIAPEEPVAGDVGRWASVGTSRPAAIRAAMKKANALPPPLSFLGYLDRVDWRLRCLDSSVSKGKVTVRFRANAD